MIKTKKPAITTCSFFKIDPGFLIDYLTDHFFRLHPGKLCGLAGGPVYGMILMFNSFEYNDYY